MEGISVPKKMSMRIDDAIRKCTSFSNDPARTIEQVPDDCVEDCPVYTRCWVLQTKDPENTMNGMKLLEKVEEEKKSEN